MAGPNWTGLIIRVEIDPISADKSDLGKANATDWMSSRVKDDNRTERDEVKRQRRRCDNVAWRGETPAGVVGLC